MLGISFRIFCGLCDSEVEFGSLGVILVVLEWLGVHFGCLGLPLELLGRNLAVILGVFGCWGGQFWGSGGAPGRLRRAMAFKDLWCLSAALPF